MNANHTEHAQNDLSQFYADRAAGVSPGRKLGMNGVPNEAYSVLNMVLDSSLNGAVSCVTSRFKSTWGRIAKYMPLRKTTENENPPKISEKKGWPGELENPDTYLFLLCSSGLKNTLQQGRATFIIRLLLKIGGFGEFEDISQATGKIAKVLELGEDDKVSMVHNLVGSMVELLGSKCNTSYEDKIELASNIAELVTLVKSENSTPQEVLAEIIKFSKKHNITEALVSMKKEIASLVYEIVENKTKMAFNLGLDVENNEKNKELKKIKDIFDEVGIDREDILSMREVFESVLKKTLESTKNTEELMPILVDEDEQTPGNKVKEILKFAKKHEILQVFIDNSQKIAALSCKIWANKSEATESIGFDKKAVKAMEPVIALVLKEGLKNEKSFPVTTDFSGVLVDMIAMDHASREKPTLVNLTDTIFQLAASNATIKDKLSSKGEKKLTAEANGVLEFLRGFSINALKVNGLAICLQNELTNLENQKKELVEFMNKRKSQGAEKSKGLVVIMEESKKLRDMVDVLQNAEIGQRTDDKLQLLTMVEEYKKEDMKKGAESRSRAKKLLDKVDNFSKVHHLCSEEKEYIKCMSQEETFFKEKKHELEREKNKTDFNGTFLTVNKTIIDSRKHIAEMLSQIKAGYMSHHELSCFSLHDQQEIIRAAKKNGLDKDEVNILLATPEMQKKVRDWKGKEAERNYAQMQGVSDVQLKHMQVDEKKALESCKKTMRLGLSSKESWTTWAVTIIASCLMFFNYSGIGFLLSSYRLREKSRERRGVPIDESLLARLIKSVNMIKDRNPEFWKKMNQTVGDDIRGILKLLVAERDRGYLYTRPKHIEENIRNIFDYVVRQGISVEKTYEPVNLLLSIWTDPESFNARYDELKKQAKMHIKPKFTNKNKRDEDHLDHDPNKKPKHKNS